MQNTAKQNYPGSVASYDTPTLGQEMKDLFATMLLSAHYKSV